MLFSHCMENWQSDKIFSVNIDVYISVLESV